MPATVTLSTTTLETPLDASRRDFRLLSTSGVSPGTLLYFDGELVRVMSLGPPPWVNVIRGWAGTAGKPHAENSTVYIGTADQFYDRDPTGRPPESILVSPWINVRNGSVWFAQGDAQPGAERWWQKQETERGIGPLGVRTKTVDLESST